MWLVGTTFATLGSNEKLQVKRCIDHMNMPDDARKEFGFIAAAIERNQLADDVRFIEEAEQKMGILIELRNRKRPLVKLKILPHYLLNAIKTKLIDNKYID